ncbi:MAG TPA: twin-arginine translocase TatA/TatE family subunit [Longimicrobium sp.]|nr:twin-arginine translocase TatA/TatE family subunit [Longimicrobium sp.]
MPFGLGFGETILILFVVLLFFGPKRLPEAASSLGKGIREFKRAVSGVGEELMAPTNTIAAAPAPPPHATLAGPGADPHAVALGASEPVAEPLRLADEPSSDAVRDETSVAADVA